MVDIDEIQYTENSSNVVSVDNAVLEAHRQIPDIHSSAAASPVLVD